MQRPQAELLLQNTFRLTKFHDNQWETINHLLNGEKVLLIEKTGFGKSLCYQFPATVFEGTTIIFSPLIALMRDQVKKLTALGISAKCINSEQTHQENTDIIQEAKDGKIKILYIAPERQENSEWIEATRQINLSMIVVDEAHCISVWGHDFRPAFRRIINLVKLLPKGLPVLATTATATNKVELDIVRQISPQLKVIRGDLLRDNLKLHVVKVSNDDDKFIWLGKNLPKLPGSGILYTGTRVDTEIYSRWFDSLNIPATFYNAGLDAESRISIEKGLMNNEWKCIISTNALGMGIDKPDIRFIIHTQITQSPIHYYQEMGRAGRDGETAYVILFYNPGDRDLPLSFIESSRPSVEKYEKVINEIKKDLLGEREIMKKTNLKQNQIRIIKSDLIEQGIIREVEINRSKKYEFIANSNPLDTKSFEELRNIKLKDLDEMIAYVETKESRMKFLCDYLGDDSNKTFTNCDNTGAKKIVPIITNEWLEKLSDFREDYFPMLDIENNKTNLVNGVAASYYGFSNIGSSIHHSKYNNGGDYPDFLLKLTLKAFRKKLGYEKFDYVYYVPPTKSGDLVKNFATKLATVLKFSISDNLIKRRETGEQKTFENGWLKSENVSDAFTLIDPNEVAGKSILLFDDILDSGATMKEIAKTLSKFGAVKITPIVIAKTVGGDI